MTYIKRNYCWFLFLGITLFIFQSCSTNTQKHIRLNDIQIIGTHNSYKQIIQPEILQLIAKNDSMAAKALEYQHKTLTQQLDSGARSLEIDILYDPIGGRYAHPFGNKILKERGNTPWPYDTLNEMQQPGYKVLHIPDLDFRTSCYTFNKALKEIKDWSNKHPSHIPIIITFNVKTSSIEKEGFTPALPFTNAAADSLDLEILSVFNTKDIITPNDVKGKYKTLNEAVLSNNWPDLDSVRGKIMLVLDEKGEKQKTYLKHAPIENRLLFVNALPGDPSSAFVILNHPVEFRDSIRSLVKMGYMVRTRADDNTWEARKNDYSHMKNSLASGAQVISTDYYFKDDEIETDFQIRFPHGIKIAYNPVLLPDSLLSEVRE